MNQADQILYSSNRMIGKEREHSLMKLLLTVTMETTPSWISNKHCEKYHLQCAPTTKHYQNVRSHIE